MGASPPRRQHRSSELTHSEQGGGGAVFTTVLSDAETSQELLVYYYTGLGKNNEKIMLSVGGDNPLGFKASYYTKLIQKNKFEISLGSEYQNAGFCGDLNICCT